jgi:hypothetical protein
MASRTFRVIIRNRSAKFVLSSTFSHLCDGGWTGGWEPPGVICFPTPGTRPTIFVCPNQTGEGAMQSESDWAFAGTEGYVKFDVLDPTEPSDQRVGMIYVYWNNPFYGTTHCKFASNSVDVPPDCDYSGPGAGSIAPPGPQASLPFTFVPSWGVVNAPDHGMYPVIGTVDDDPQAADFAAASAAFGVGAAVGVGVGGLVAGVGDLVATTGVIDHAWIQIDLIDGAPANVGSIAGQSARAPTYAQDRNPSASDWSGHWVGNDVTVDISSPGLTGARVLRPAPLSVSISDKTAQPPITMTRPVDLARHARIPARSAFSTLTAGEVARNARSEVKPFVSSHRAQTLAHRNSVVLLRGLELPRDSNGTAYIDGAIYLPEAIVLRLYKEYESVTFASLRLVYQRIGADGRMATNQRLVRPIKIG